MLVKTPRHLRFASQICLTNMLSFLWQEGELDAVAIVHSYEENMAAGSHKTRLAALNVGLFLKSIVASVF